MMALKISLSLWFYKLMQRPWQRLVITIMLIVTLTVGLAYFLFGIFQCGIPNGGQAFWEKKLENKCVSQQTNEGLSYTHGLLNALIDIILVAMPIAMIWGAKLSTKEKLSIIIIIFIAIR
jgi:hypothetical protein